MSIRTEAEENLRIIRSLMEKATVYRAISAPAAAVGGVLALAGSFAFGNWASGDHQRQAAEVSTAAFIGLWLGVLAIAGVANCVFLHRDAKRRNEPFVSSGMRLAVSALAPPFLVAGFFTLFALKAARPGLIVCVWTFCYGLALLATSHFAPKSLIRLGWTFLIAGFLSLSFPLYLDILALSGGNVEARLRSVSLLGAQRWMALSFGVFHLIYAACAWPRGAARAEA